MQNGDPDSLPEVRNNPVVQHSELRNWPNSAAELAQTMVVYGNNHPDGAESCKARWTNCRAS